MYERPEGLLRHQTGCHEDFQVTYLDHCHQV